MTETRKRVTSSETEATRERAAPEANGGMEPDHNLQARIADRAYELYLQRGEKEGHAMDDWLQAEREITGGASTGGLLNPRPFAVDGRPSTSAWRENDADSARDGRYGRSPQSKTAHLLDFETLAVKRYRGVRSADVATLAPETPERKPESTDKRERLETALEHQDKILL